MMMTLANVRAKAFVLPQTSRSFSLLESQLIEMAHCTLDRLARDVERRMCGSLRSKKRTGFRHVFRNKLSSHKKT